MYWVSALSPNHALLESSYMNPLSIRPQTVLRAVLRVTLVLVTTAYPLLAIVIGGEGLLTWTFLPRGYEHYYVDHWSLRHAGWWLLVGMIGLLPTGWVLFQPQASLRWLSLPTLVSLVLIIYPSANPSADERARYQVFDELSRFAVEVRQAAEQGKPWHCTSGPTTTLSPYSRAGERLFYQRVCVAANRPTASLLASSAPGTIYIATGPDEQVVWLRATALPSNATNIVRWLRVRSGEPLVLAGELSLSEEMDPRLVNRESEHHERKAETRAESN